MTTAASTPSLYRRTQRRIYEIMDGAVVDKFSHFVEVFIALLVVANVIGIILESVPEIHQAYSAEFHAFDFFSVLIFSVEYVLRVWSYGAKYSTNEGGSDQSNNRSGRKDYVLSFYGIIDFVSTVPFYLQLLFPGADLRVLRMFRLLRIFKLSRYNSAFEDMVAAVKAERDSCGDALVCHHHHFGLGQCGPCHIPRIATGGANASFVYRPSCHLDRCGGHRLHRASRAPRSLVRDGGARNLGRRSSERRRASSLATNAS